MKKALLPAVMMAATLGLGGCAVESGNDFRLNEYGMANRANLNAQKAYGVSGARLLDLSKDFKAKSVDTVNFAFNKSTIDAEAREILKGQAAWLRAHPGVRMRIVGHTDLVGTNRYNFGLGLRRARAVLRYLRSQGVSRRRLAAVASRGEREPIVVTEARERRNRRAVTMVSGVIRRFVGTGLDGEYAATVYDSYQAGK